MTVALAAASAASRAEDAAMPHLQPVEPPAYRPVPVSAAGTDWPVVSLCGAWQFRVNPGDAFYADPARPVPGAADIDVPGEWVMQGFTVPKDQAAGYRRSFTLDASWKQARVILRADAVFSDCRLWINGRQAGAHLGGFTPFELDVTDLVKQGRNHIALCVRSESVADSLASAAKYAVHPLGGITRKIRLFAVPATHVAMLHVATDLDASYKDADVKVMADLRNDSAADAKVSCTLDILGPWRLGKPLRPDANKPLESRRETIVVKPGQTLGTAFNVALRGAALWHTEHPDLYRARLTISVDGKAPETVQRTFGCKKVEVRGNQVFVNGKVQKVFGVCRHEVHPLRGRSLAGDLWRRDVELYRAGNVNLLRTSHYCSAEELFDAADELGMFIECEAPFCWAQDAKALAGAITEATVRQTVEMGQFYRSHPCVLFWSLGNESFWNDHFKASSAALRGLDPTRPQTVEHFRGNPPADANYCEIFSTHYPGPGGPDKYQDSARPVNFGEYCHLNAYNRHELSTDPGLRDAWGGPTSRMVENMRGSRGVFGGSFWAAMDDTFFIPPPRDDPREPVRVVGYGTWGPLDGWRRCKPEYWHMKKSYSPVRVLTENVDLPPGGGDVTVRVANRYVFTNLKELQVQWQAGADKGTARPDVAPGATGSFTVSLPPSSATRDLLVRFISPLGFVVDESIVGSTPAAPAAKADAGPAKVAATDKAVTFPTGPGASISVGRDTGLFGEARLSARTVAIGGPHLMILPLNGAGETQMTGKDPAYPISSSPCANWKPDGPGAFDGNSMTVAGTYDEAKGAFTYRQAPPWCLEVSYSFTCDRDVNPRQVGVVFDLPRSFDTLTWKRKGLWSFYPADHIGRTRGTARAFPPNVDICSQVGPKREPSWPWKDDTTQNGSNDFRSTKANILSACLRAGDGAGAVEVVSDGTQHVRAWVDGAQVRLLVANYSNAGAEKFFARHASVGYAPLKKGDKVEGKVRLRLLPQAPGHDAAPPGRSRARP
jgi:hypothetical protein